MPWEKIGQHKSSSKLFSKKLKKSSEFIESLKRTNDALSEQLNSKEEDLRKKLECIEHFNHSGEILGQELAELKGKYTSLIEEVLRRQEEKESNMSALKLLDNKLVKLEKERDVRSEEIGQLKSSSKIFSKKLETSSEFNETLKES